jgi:hypothetical protein
VDQVGRNSETTLRIASLHVETGGVAAAALKALANRFDVGSE